MSLLSIDNFNGAVLVVNLTALGWVLIIFLIKLIDLPYKDPNIEIIVHFFFSLQQISANILFHILIKKDIGIDDPPS